MTYMALLSVFPFEGFRRSIAKAMVKSKYTAPHVSAMDDADVTELWQIRRRRKRLRRAEELN